MKKHPEQNKEVEDFVETEKVWYGIGFLQHIDNSSS
jgi:hypothetical protein